MAAAWSGSTAAGTRSRRSPGRCPTATSRQTPRTGSSGRTDRADTGTARTASSAATAGPPGPRTSRRCRRTFREAGRGGRRWSCGRPFVNDRGELARGLAEVLDARRVRYLPRPGLAAQLPDRLDLMVPALHVALRQVPAPGVHRKPATRAQRPAREQLADVSVGGVVHPGEDHRDVNAEAVVDLHGIDRFGTVADHVEQVLGDHGL